MITRFKIFENQKNKIFEDEDDLVELFSQKFIEDYYEEHWEVDFEDDVANSLNLWNYVDKNAVASKFIQDIVNYKSIDDKEFGKTDYIQYIADKEYMSLEMEDLQKMSREQLIELIEDEGEEREFITDFLEDKYSETDPEEILYDIYGKNAVKDNGYSYLKDFIDEEELIEIYKDKLDFEIKQNYLKDFISRDEKLQKMLLDMDPNTIPALYDVMNDESIGTTYEFQKKYLDYMTSELDIKPDDYDDEYPDILKELNNRFGLNPKIEEEYREYTYLIDTEKYNL